MFEKRKNEYLIEMKKIKVLLFLLFILLLYSVRCFNLNGLEYNLCGMVFIYYCFIFFCLSCSIIEK